MKRLQYKGKMLLYYISKKLLHYVSDDEYKIMLVEELARVLSTKMVGIYADEDLEDILCSIGNNISTEFVDNPNPDTVLHVMTEAYEIGGHTRVVDNWIKNDTSRKHTIVLTSTNKVPQFLKNSVAQNEGQIIYLHGNGYKNKALALLQMAVHYDKIILHTHMHDSIPTIAFSNAGWKRPIYLFNHANFRFWLGVSIADVCLDISYNDHLISKKLRGVRNSVRLDIPIEKPVLEQKEKNDPVLIREKMKIKKDDLVVTTMAGSQKYHSVGKINFFGFVDALLASNQKIVFVAIGPSSTEDGWDWLRKKYKKRIRVMGKLPKAKVAEILDITQMYVNSFPLGSYTACLEASRRGIPVTGLNLPGNTLDIYQEGLKNTCSELVEYLNDIASEKVSYSEVMVDRHYKEAWCKKLEKIFDKNITHRVRRFKSGRRFGFFEEVVLSSYQQEKWEASAEIGWVWKCLFYLLAV